MDNSKIQFQTNQPGSILWYRYTLVPIEAVKQSSFSRNELHASVSVAGRFQRNSFFFGSSNLAHQGYAEAACYPIF